MQCAHVRAFGDRHEWGRLSEGSKKLDPLAGAGLVGLENVGNSCYFNSVMQILFSLPEFKERYQAQAEATFRRAPRKPAEDINTQMSKLAVALTTTKYGECITNGVAAGSGLHMRNFVLI